MVMHASRSSLLVSLFLVGAFAGCHCEEGADDGDGGEGGGVPTCSSEGIGSIEITVVGLPEGIDADVTLTGEADEAHATATGTIADLAAGSWGISAGIVTEPDPIVRTAYRATIDSETLCVADGAVESVTVTYAAIPSSHKVWLTNSNGTSSLLAFESESLATSGDRPATVAASSGAGRDVTFDHEGNLWTLGGTTADAPLMRFAAETLGATGDKTPDREIVLELPCLPGTAGLAFDPEGNLWFTSPCAGSISRLTAADLESSGMKTPAVVLGGLEAVGSIAFDRDGNLWAADTPQGRVVRFDAARLTESGDSVDRAVITATDNGGFYGPSWIAFDENGDLWVNDFGANAVIRLPAADLAGTGETTITPPVRITIGVTALLESMAFDESGGLWMGGSQGSAIRLAPEQLGESSGPGDPTLPATILESGDIGYATNFAFYPAPAALPLFHALDD
jgi:streptogramin lyase